MRRSGLHLPVKENCYRIAQEGLYNEVKRAHPSVVQPSLAGMGHAVVLLIQESGHGFDHVASWPGHQGERSIRERDAIPFGIPRLERAAGARTRACASALYILGR